jgi:transposase
MSGLYWLTDEQVERLRPIFPKSHGKPRVDDRRAVRGIVSSTAMGWAGAMRPAPMAPTRRCTIGGSGGASEACLPA